MDGCRKVPCWVAITVQFYGLNPNLSPIMIIEKKLASNYNFWRCKIKAAFFIHFSSWCRRGPICFACLSGGNGRRLTDKKGYSDTEDKKGPCMSR